MIQIIGVDNITSVLRFMETDFSILLLILVSFFCIIWLLFFVFEKKLNLSNPNISNLNDMAMTCFKSLVVTGLVDVFYIAFYTDWYLPDILS